MKENTKKKEDTLNIENKYVDRKYEPNETKSQNELPYTPMRNSCDAGISSSKPDFQVQKTPKETDLQDIFRKKPENKLKEPKGKENSVKIPESPKQYLEMPQSSKRSSSRNRTNRERSRSRSRIRNELASKLDSLFDDEDLESPESPQNGNFL